MPNHSSITEVSIQHFKTFKTLTRTDCWTHVDERRLRCKLLVEKRLGVGICTKINGPAKRKNPPYIKFFLKIAHTKIIKMKTQRNEGYLVIFQGKKKPPIFSQRAHGDVNYYYLAKSPSEYMKRSKDQLWQSATLSTHAHEIYVTTFTYSTVTDIPMGQVSKIIQ